MNIADRIEQALEWTSRQPDVQSLIRELGQLAADFERVADYCRLHGEYLELEPWGGSTRWEAAIGNIDGTTGYGDSPAEALHKLAAMLPQSTEEAK